MDEVFPPSNSFEHENNEGQSTFPSFNDIGNAIDGGSSSNSNPLVGSPRSDFGSANIQMVNSISEEDGRYEGNYPDDYFGNPHGSPFPLFGDALSPLQNAREVHYSPPHSSSPSYPSALKPSYQDDHFAQHWFDGGGAQQQHRDSRRNHHLSSPRSSPIVINGRNNIRDSIIPMPTLPVDRQRNRTAVRFPKVPPIGVGEGSGRDRSRVHKANRAKLVSSSQRHQKFAENGPTYPSPKGFHISVCCHCVSLYNI